MGSEFAGSAGGGLTADDRRYLRSVIICESISDHLCKKRLKMQSTQIQLEWERIALEKYKKVIQRIPLFHREIAQKVVDKKAVLNAQERGSNFVEECDILRAFFSEVPNAFYSLMIRLLDEVGFDYKKYEPN